MHKILDRQLKKLGLCREELPTQLDSWQLFLKNVDSYYKESDSDRYRIERSMDISSNEMQQLNLKLQSAQDMAQLGYWTHNLATGENNWSLKIFQLFDLDLSANTPSLAEIIEHIHPDDRAACNTAIENAINHGTPYTLQNRMRGYGENQEYKWYQVICEPSEPVNGKYTKLEGVVMDINDRRNSELEIERLNSQLVDTARRAGMSEVATSMLHNIGNVLNSANTTTELVKEELANVVYERLPAIAELLSKNKSNLTDYLAADETGKKIPEYIIALSNRITESNNHMRSEIDSLLTHLHHISEITSMHKPLSGVSGVKAKLKLSQAIDEALAICNIGIKNSNIKLTKNIKEDITLVSDKHKLIQIIINLVKNAVESLSACTTLKDKEIIISTFRDEEFITLSVKDNGLGIDSETLKQLFKFGFTTKKDGHGFGLHGSALTAKELNAQLTADSSGAMHGAEFVLKIRAATPVGVT